MQFIIMADVIVKDIKNIYQGVWHTVYDEGTVFCFIN